MIMNAHSPVGPPLSSMGAPIANSAIRTAMLPSSVRRPNRSASRPETSVAPRPIAAPMTSIIRKRPGVSEVKRTIHDSGNTVTMWNSAKLASGAKAPSTIVRPSARMVSSTGAGWSARDSNKVSNSGVTTRRRRANSATTLIANATKNG